MNIHPTCHRLFLFLLIFIIPSITSARKGYSQPPATSSIDKLINHGSYIVSKGQDILLASNANSKYATASIWKILTAAHALHQLGPSYRFQTRFYRSGQDDLIIKGQGDPFLISEEVTKIVDNLHMQKLPSFHNVIIDSSAFALDPHPEGSSGSQNPYDANNTALAVNFNTVHFIKSADGHVSSAEDQTPNLPIMKRLGRMLPAGRHRIALSHKPEQTATYAAQLFKAFDSTTRSPQLYEVKMGVAPANAVPCYIHNSSKSLPEIIEALLLYSNNFIANQLFLTCGAVRFGYPATWEKGRMAQTEFLERELNLSKESFSVTEGSGLSRHNSMTAEAMLKVLYYFKPYAHLLPISNHNRIKSGTLTGVYSYAGYFEDGSELDPFVIILNQKKNNRDRVLALLEKFYRSRVN